MPQRREYSEAEIQAAVQQLSEPDRLDEAQRVVAAAAPALQGILEQSLEAADWFGSAHRAQVLEAAGREDPTERLGEDLLQRGGRDRDHALRLVEPRRIAQDPDGGLDLRLGMGRPVGH